MPRPDVDPGASTTCTGSPAAVSSGRADAFRLRPIANSWPIWRGRPARRAPFPQLKLLLLAAAEAAAQGGRSRSAQRHSGRRHLRPACAQRHYRQGWWIGLPPYPNCPARDRCVWAWQRIGSQLIDWPLEHVVKCLVFYHPDNRRRCVQAGRPCCSRSGRPVTVRP